MTKQIKITSFSEVRTLQHVASEYPVDIWVTDSNGSSADAKSLLGLMSLSYTDPVQIVVEDSDNDILEMFMRKLSDEGCLETLFKKLNPKLFDKE